MAQEQDNIEIVSTKAQRLKKTSLIDFKVTSFESHKAKSKCEDRSLEPKKSYDEENDDIVSSVFAENKQTKQRKYEQDGNEFSIKSARNEVIRFAMSGGYHKVKKNKAEKKLLIKLGAKPGKQNCRNYKELLQEKIRVKKIKEERTNLKRLNKNGKRGVLVKSNKKMKKQIVNGITQNYGVIKKRK